METQSRSGMDGPGAGRASADPPSAGAPSAGADGGMPLAELVASLALATDLAMAHPVEQGLGTCIIATRMAELAGLSVEERSRTLYLALLRHSGCTTENDQLAALAGDEIRLSGRMAPLCGSTGADYLRTIARFATEGRSFLSAAITVGRLVAGMREFEAVNRAICEVAQMLAARLGFDALVTTEIGAVYERWDGAGFPNHLKGEHIPLTIRLTQVADLATVLHDLGHEDPASVVAERVGERLRP
jgi:hypothetical protein